jgi:AraC-like DNA-binding protein
MKNYLERASLTWSKNSIRLIETASPTAKENYLYIQEAGYFETFFPYFTERQNLQSFLLIYTISGKGRLLYEGNEFGLEKGKIFLINCTNYHYYESSKDAPWEFLWIHFHGFNALHYYEELTNNGFPLLTLEDSFLIESALRRIISLHQRKDVHRELITSNLITQILTELILLAVPTEYLNHNVPTYVNKIKQKLNTEYKDKINLDGLALEFNIDKFHMSKVFKKYTGTTINEYLIDQRISHAKELLKYSEMPVSEITYECGMNNVSHFINLFKEREGKTPYLFRKEWK